jgi:hypothetical protein
MPCQAEEEIEKKEEKSGYLFRWGPVRHHQVVAADDVRFNILVAEQAVRKDQLEGVVADNISTGSLLAFPGNQPEKLLRSGVIGLGLHEF